MKIYKLEIFKEKHEPGTPVEEGELVMDGGISGDRGGAKGGARQISFLDTSMIKNIEENPGDFGLCAHKYKANITTEGLDLSEIKVGDILDFGEAQVEITIDNKKCWPDDCDIAARGEECPLKRGVAMGAVKVPGTIRSGQEFTVIKK